MINQKHRVIIHIGLHKTGTTYLQYNFFPKLRDTIYLHGSHILKQWSEQSSANCEWVLLSYEGFSGLPWFDPLSLSFESQSGNNWLKSFELNIKNLRKAFDNPIIIVFFRKPGDLLLSIYKQYVYAGGVHPINDFYGYDKIVSDDDLSILARIDLLDETFEKVYYLNYERFKSQGDDYLVDFFRRELGVYVDNNTGKIIKNNHGIKGWKIDALRVINRFYFKLPKKLRGLVRLLRLSPRDFLQSHLSFIKAEEHDYLSVLQQEVNLKFDSEWHEFENKYQWRQ